MESQQPDKLEILAAEDGIDNQMLIQLSLKKYPARLDLADDGEQAVQMFARQPYDVVLMDMMMPVKNGYIATREIRELEREQKRKPAFIML